MAQERQEGPAWSWSEKASAQRGLFIIAIRSVQLIPAAESCLANSRGAIRGAGVRVGAASWAVRLWGRPHSGGE